MKTAGIVGAGIVGRLLALQLIKNGWQVTIFDGDTKEGKSSCSYAAAGILAPFAELEKAESLIFNLGMESLQLWDSLLQQLNQPVYFKKTGSLLVSHAQDMPELKRFKERIESKLNTPDAIKILTDNEISTLEPGLKWPNTVLYLPQEGHIDNRMLLTSLAATLIEQGIIWKENCFIENVESGKIISATENYLFDLVCDCRGLGAKKTFPALRGVRGEIIHLYAPEVNITRPIRFFHPRYRLYIVPRPNNKYLVGASEIESEDLSPISVRTILELLSTAYSIHAGFAEARLIETITNCRPAFADNLPRLFYEDGLLGINGLYRHGYLLAPALVNKAVAMIEQGSDRNIIL